MYIYASVSFGNYRRRRRDVLMGRQGYEKLRRLGDVPLIRRWVFHLRLVWDVEETYWWDVVVMSSWNVAKISWRCTTETSWRGSTEMSLVVSFETYLQGHWDVQMNVITTSLGHPASGWVRMKHQIFMSLSWKSDGSKIEARKPYFLNKQC